MTPQTTFDPQPTYIPNDVIVITLDDVPSDTITPMDLDWLKSENMHVDLFINTMNWSGMEGWPIITRMYNEGHYLGNHTVHHDHLAQMPPSHPVESEIADNEATIVMLTNNAIKNLTRFRAPYGEPYQPGGPPDDGVEATVAKYAVHIGWNFDSGDTAGITAGTALFNNVVSLIKTPGQGDWGIMLAHGVNQQTHDMLPMLIPYLQQNNFRLGNVEDVVCWMFGKHSWEIIPGKTAN